MLAMNKDDINTKKFNSIPENETGLEKDTDGFWYKFPEDPRHCVLPPEPAPVIKKQEIKNDTNRDFKIIRSKSKVSIKGILESCLYGYRLDCGDCIILKRVVFKNYCGIPEVFSGTAFSKIRIDTFGSQVQFWKNEEDAENLKPNMVLMDI